MATPLIELRGVGRCYRMNGVEVRALDSIDLCIDEGEFVAIVGQSGSGKSTLMNVLGCLDVPTSGQYLLGGSDTAALTPDESARLRREGFGFVFQRYHLLPHLDALGNVALPAVYAGVTLRERTKRATDLLRDLGLHDRLHHRPTELSGGQQQRVSIARALMNGGGIVLADEPTGALDSRSGAETLAALRALHERGRTVIIVTHDAQHVAACARRVIEIADGRIVRDTGSTVAVPQADQAALGDIRAPIPQKMQQPASPPTLAHDKRSVLAGLWKALTGRLARPREAFSSAVQALIGHRLRSALSMLGISIGVAAVVSIVALTAAAQRLIDREVGDLFGNQLKVWSGNPKLPAGVQPRPFRVADLDAVRRLPGVRGVTVERRAEMQARQGSRDARTKVYGADTMTMSANRLSVVEGRAISALEFEHGAQVVVIDRQSKDALFRAGERALGATVLLAPEPAPQSAAVPANVRTNAPPAAPTLPFTVIGVFEAGSGSAFRRDMIGQVLIPHVAYGLRLDTRPDVSAFNVVMENTADADLVHHHVVQRLVALHGVEDFDIWDAASSTRSTKQVLAVAGVLLGAVGAIALVVGGVGVMNMMLVSVAERTREIGIRMAVGARRADIQLQFLIESVVLCCTGGLCGLVLTALAALVVNLAQKRIVFEIDSVALLAAVGISSAVGILFGTLPARRAAALSPVDALARE
jgi:macrolide transport system ATP-binding/permease protein